MQVWEIVLLSVALAMDAVAVGMTDGMAEPKMRLWKMFAVAGAFALFQGVMPLLGYFCGYAFTSVVKKIAPWLSFALLVFIGGKAIADSLIERAKKKKGEPAAEKKPLGAAKLLLQAVATSLDALAVGVTLLAADASVGLPFHVVFCALVIGAVTMLLALPAVAVGKKAGDAFAGGAEIAGGVVLILIGVKILIEGLL